MAHLTRYCMYKRIRENLELPMKGKILGISGIRSFYPFMDMKNCKITEAEFPKVDMQNMSFEDEMFDFVISDQVLEHLEDPQKAINESYRALKTGGTAVITTCFMNYIHPDPIDLWRFTPEALRYLCRDFSEIICCEGWGNRLAILLCFLSRKGRYMEIPESRYSMRNFLATYNEERVPIVTWIIAKK